MMSNVPTFLNGLVVGVILFQTAIIAPTVFRGLGPDQAGPFLRKVFPKFFVVLVVIGISGAISAVASDAIYQLGICLVTLTLGLLAYLLIPMMFHYHKYLQSMKLNYMLINQHKL